MTHMDSVPAFQFRHPMPLVIQLKPDYRTPHPSTSRFIQ
jgi:hypothetical protein